MTLALTAKISVEPQSLHADRKVHALAHEFLVARLRAAKEAGSERWAFPLIYR